MSIVFAAVPLLAFYIDSKALDFSTHLLMMLLAIFGIQGRLVMNLLDGMVAVEHNRKSLAGGLFNEVPDRISDSITLLGLVFLLSDRAYGRDLVYLAIALSVTTAYIRTLGASLNCGHHFLGPMAKQHRMALLSICCILAIWYPSVFYYGIILMNLGLLFTCYRRLARVYQVLLNDSTR